VRAPRIARSLPDLDFQIAPQDMRIVWGLAARVETMVQKMLLDGWVVHLQVLRGRNGLVVAASGQVYSHADFHRREEGEHLLLRALQCRSSLH
jgi:hypothetical protein